MNSRLGIACLFVSALIAMAMAGVGCYKSSTVVNALPSPSPCGSICPDTLFVQTSNVPKAIREYKGVSKNFGALIASATFPTSNISNPDVVYDKVTDTLWFPEANGNAGTNILIWSPTAMLDGKNPSVVVPFPNSEGTAAYDPNHDLLFAAVDTGPDVAVFHNATAMTSSSMPTAVMDMQINDPTAPSPGPRPQEIFYDPGTDRLFASDNGSDVLVFDNFGATAAAAIGPTNIAPSRYITGFFSPDGLAYAPMPSDVLFVGEQRVPGDVIVVSSASTFSGNVSHSQQVTGFSKPGGMQYESVRNLLFVYDTSPVYVLDGALTISGNLNSLLAEGTVKTIFDASGESNEGFGLALITDPIPPSPSPSPSASAAIRIRH